MKNNKVPGPEDLPADISKLEGPQDKAVTWLTDFFNAITEGGHVPSAWVMSIMVSIFKNKGDPAVCSNYCQIWLLPHTMKVFK